MLRTEQGARALLRMQLEGPDLMELTRQTHTVLLGEGVAAGWTLLIQIDREEQEAVSLELLPAVRTLEGH